MENRITAVLDIYHEMIRKEREEREHRRGRPLELGTGELDRRLLAIGPQTGQFINILARSLTAPTILELGTSYGYSGIWLADAARAAGGRLITVETKDYKSAFAHEMSEKAGLAEYVRFFVGDAIQITQNLQENLISSSSMCRTRCICRA